MPAASPDVLGVSVYDQRTSEFNFRQGPVFANVLAILTILFGFVAVTRLPSVDGGEMALMHGMAGSIYGVATAVGMLVLARPGSALDGVGVGFALLTMVCNVSFQLLTRQAHDAHLDPDRWLQTAPRTEGSWWPAWQQWLAERSSGRVAPPGITAKTATALGDAPGTYVHLR